MSFGVYKHNISITSETPTGDAGLALNTNFKNIADLFDTVSSFQGAYSNSTTYALGNVVTYGGSAYICIVAGSGSTPPSSNWSTFASQGPAGVAGSAGATGPAGPSPSGSANQILATPNGSSGTAVLRALVATDIPALPESAISGLVTDLGNKASAASPALTGTPTAPTAATSTSTTQIATTAFVTGQAATAAPLMDGTAAVGTSLLYGRQDHVHPTDTTRASKVSSAVANDIAILSSSGDLVDSGVQISSLGGKASTVSPAFTGTPTAPTAATNTNTTQLATTAFVLGQAGTANPLMDGTAAVGSSLLYARQDHVHPSDTTKANKVSSAVTNDVAILSASGDLVDSGVQLSSLSSKAGTNSPAFTGTPTAPTAAANTNTTQIATTAFVLGQAGTATPLQDGTAAVGSSYLYARQDHVHPSDTLQDVTGAGNYTTNDIDIRGTAKLKNTTGTANIIGTSAGPSGLYTVQSSDNLLAAGGVYLGTGSGAVTQSVSDSGGIVVSGSGAISKMHADSAGTVTASNTSHADSNGNVTSGCTGAHANSGGVVSASSTRAFAAAGGTANGNYSSAMSAGTAGVQYSHADSGGSTSTYPYAHADSLSIVSGFAAHADSTGTASNTYSHAHAGGNAAAVYSTAQGPGALSYNYGQVATGGANHYSAMATELTLWGRTNSTAYSFLYTGAGTLPTVTSGKMYAGSLRIIASTGDGLNLAQWFANLVIKVDAFGTVTLVQNVSISSAVSVGTVTGWGYAISTSSSNSLAVSITGGVGQTVQWIGYFDAVEMSFQGSSF